MSELRYQCIEAKSGDFAAEAARTIATGLMDAIKERGECILGLSGGSTPGPAYTLLGKDTSVDWDSVRLFLVDERFVPPDHEESNTKLLRGTLLNHAPIPAKHITFPDTSLPHDACVAAYSESLVHLFSRHAPDVMVLGLGNDGHIASLFPPVPEEAFEEILALHTRTDQSAVHDRITVSPLVIMASKHCILLLKGKEKRGVFEQCVQADLNPVRWPLHVPLSTGGLMVVMGD